MLQRSYCWICGHRPGFSTVTATDLSVPRHSPHDAVLRLAKSSDIPPNSGDNLDPVRALFEEHGNFVWRTAARLGVAEHERDDVVQDVFLVVHRRLDDYEGRGAMTSWLYGIVRGLVRNRRRRKTRRQHLQAIVPPQGVQYSPDPESAQAFETFVGRLSEPRREVFVLSEVEGMSGPEIAAALGIKLNTVYSRLRVAKREFGAFAKKIMQEG